MTCDCNKPRRRCGVIPVRTCCPNPTAVNRNEFLEYKNDIKNQLTEVDAQLKDKTIEIKDLQLKDAELESGKQNKLVAGNNITLTDDQDTKTTTISATGSAGAYTAGDGINITNNEVSVNNTIQRTLTAGDNIEIQNDIISAEIPNVYGFDTVADMKASTELKDGDYAITAGYYAKDDGGAAKYEITDTGTANEMDVIAVGSLFASIVLEKEVNVKQLGAYGDDTHDDSSYIARALWFDLPVYIPSGIYKITQSLSIGSNNIRGAGQFKTFIKAYNDISGNVLTLAHSHTSLSGFTLISPDYDYSVPGTTNQNTGIYISDKHYITIRNVRVVGFNRGIHADYAWCLSCYDSMFMCCNIGIWGVNEFNNSLLERCVIHTNGIGFQFSGGYGVVCNACDIEKNTRGVVITSYGDITFYGCYFETNPEAMVRVEWGTDICNTVTIDSCTFLAGPEDKRLVEYHGKATTMIVLRDCDIRAKNTVAQDAIPIFVKLNNSTQCVPRIVGGYINEKYTILDEIYNDRRGPVLLNATDWITPGTDITIDDFTVYEDNKHIYGWVTFTSATPYPAGSVTSLGVLKDKYKPAKNVNGFAALSDNRWQQTSNNLCYFYISGTGISTRNGDGVCKLIKAHIDYVRN